MRLILVASMMLVPSLTGCTTWRPAALGPSRIIQEEQPGSIRIVQSDGTRVVVRDPTMERDSVAGVVRTLRSRGGMRSDTVRIALADIASVETKGFSARRTVALVLIPAVPVLLFLGDMERRVGLTDSMGRLP